MNLRAEASRIWSRLILDQPSLAFLHSANGMPRIANRGETEERRFHPKLTKEQECVFKQLLRMYGA